MHELIGHGNSLASERFARLYRQAGGAARRMTSEETLDVVSRVFWFTLEFGVLREDGELRAYGAGLLSSYGEIEEFRGAELRPLDVHAMADAALRHHALPAGAVLRRGLRQVEEVVGGWFDAADDELVRRTVAEPQLAPGA